MRSTLPFLHTARRDTPCMLEDDDRPSPPDDAYGRVADSGRYRRLYDHGAALVERLQRIYDVEVQEDAVDEDLTVRPTDRVVRLVPANADAATITIAFTDFPGLIVRYGDHHVVAYPRCGCDACDEDVGRLIEEMEQQFNDLAEGRFSEAVGRRERTYIFGARMTTERLPSPTSRKERGRRLWSSWPERAASLKS